MIAGFIDVELDDAVERVRTALGNFCNYKGLLQENERDNGVLSEFEDEESGTRIFNYSIRDKDIEVRKDLQGRIDYNFRIDIKFELSSIERNSQPATSIKISSSYSRPVLVLSLGTTAISFLLSPILFAIFCVQLLLLHIYIEDKAWTELDKKLVHVNVGRSKKFSASQHWVYKLLIIIGSIWTGAWWLIPFCLTGFPIPLALVLFIPNILNTLLTKLLTSDKYETRRQKTAELQQIWVQGFVHTQIFLAGLIVFVWNLTNSLASQSNRISSLDVYSPTFIGDLMSVLKGLLEVSWFPFDIQNKVISPEVFSRINESTYGVLGQNNLLVIMIAMYLIPIGVIGDAFSICLKKYRLLLREFPSREAYIIKRRTVKTSRTLRLLLTISYITNVVSIPAAIGILVVFIPSFLDPIGAQGNLLTSPFRGFAQLMDSVFGPVSNSLKIQISILISLPIILALTPGSLFSIFEGFKARRLYRRYPCGDPDIEQWVKDACEKLEVENQVWLITLPELKSKESRKLRIVPLLYTRMYGILRRRVFIVIARELLDTEVMPRNLLHAALAHEIAHALEDLHFFDYLAKLSSLSGYGRGYLSLLIDYDAIEFRADYKAAKHMKDHQLVIKAIKSIRRKQEFRKMFFDSLPKPKGILPEIIEMFSYLFTPQVLSVAYSDDETRIQRLEEKFSGKSKAAGSS